MQIQIKKQTPSSSLALKGNAPFVILNPSPLYQILEEMYLKMKAKKIRCHIASEDRIET
jgi:hypothetical protein